MKSETGYTKEQAWATNKPKQITIIYLGSRYFFIKFKYGIAVDEIGMIHKQLKSTIEIA